jgi:hypothetical protein
MGLISIQQAFDLALQHDQAGRLQEAEQLYRQILARQPIMPKLYICWVCWLGGQDRKTLQWS